MEDVDTGTYNDRVKHTKNRRNLLTVEEATFLAVHRTSMYTGWIMVIAILVFVGGAVIVPGR